MKRFIIVSLVFVLLLSAVVFAEKGGNPSPPGLEDKEVKGQGVDKDSPASAKDNKSSGKEAPGKSDAAGLQIHKNMSKAEKDQVLDQLRNKTLGNKQLLESRLENVSNRDKQKVFRNQNTVREAVMNLLALREAGNFSGGIGQNISAIARGFDNSVNKTVEAEEAIQNRAGLMRFFFGGEENAAATIQAELNQNRVRLQQLQRVREEYDPEFQAFIDEQMLLIEEEQTRLQELAQQELGDKGLLGWLFK
ncbi:MAG: hypothetical protein JW778_02630 [Candidatus Altiarchaeota archaeon]|nr:hypothetical protein [Candidatus Altiarchaeota archaeon]